MIKKDIEGKAAILIDAANISKELMRNCDKYCDLIKFKGVFLSKK